MNKYSRWYNQIVKNAQNRVTEGYTERHHIQPRSLGGTDDKSNLVDLTAREHFICHWLLTKMYAGEARGKMINALYLMQGKNQHQDRYINSKVYANLREEYSQYISNLNKGRVQPLAENVKQKAAQIGRKRSPFSEEWKAKMSAAKLGENNNRFGVEVSEDTRRKIGDKIRGRKQTDEEKARRAEANKGKVKPKKLCPHCNQMIAVNTYTRWHGVNCKSKS